MRYMLFHLDTFQKRIFGRSFSSLEQEVTAMDISLLREKANKSLEGSALLWLIFMQLLDMWQMIDWSGC